MNATKVDDEKSNGACEEEERGVDPVEASFYRDLAREFGTVSRRRGLQLLLSGSLHVTSCRIDIVRAYECDVDRS